MDTTNSVCQNFDDCPKIFKTAELVAADARMPLSPHAYVYNRIS